MSEGRGKSDDSLLTYHSDNYYLLQLTNHNVVKSSEMFQLQINERSRSERGGKFMAKRFIFGE